ncbi:redox-regulated ATPase YchF [Abyssisolibacter fermentans]|uniref:redox-regulated ATPase YchF n=1 Tax=Abyssisolibacter fermentans TaxID=1766203 RepID=UPI0008310EF4|nr:redox-regulated ATPase YchF [Abyssisolibacter fermentans]
MKLGIVGLPNVGKSTLFNAITSAGAESANYPFCTIEPNVGVVSVPDERLDVLEKMYSSHKKVPTAIEFFDIAGLVRGASKGEGLGNKFLSHIREVEAIVHVVRCFEDENITHVEGNIDPIRDIEIIDLELILADLDMVTKRISRVEKQAKSDKVLLKELEYLKKALEALENSKPVRSVEFTEEEIKYNKIYNFLTNKPVLYAANISEEDIVNEKENNHLTSLLEYAKKEGSEVITICGKVEAEISELDQEEKEMFLEELGLKESGLDKLIKSSYKLLGLISFLTAGEKEVRAWTIKEGWKAPQAAGRIHTDFEKGFIKAAIITYEDLVECGSLAVAKDKGLLRLEGKDYVMKDGDVVEFRFNV